MAILRSACVDVLAQNPERGQDMSHKNKATAVRNADQTILISVDISHDFVYEYFLRARMGDDGEPQVLTKWEDTWIKPKHIRSKLGKLRAENLVVKRLGRAVWQKYANGTGKERDIVVGNNYDYSCIGLVDSRMGEDGEPEILAKWGPTWIESEGIQSDIERLEAHELMVESLGQGK